MHTSKVRTKNVKRVQKRDVLAKQEASRDAELVVKPGKKNKTPPPHFSRLLAHLITIPENWNREGDMGERTWESLGDPTTGTLKGSFTESEKKAV